MGQERIKAGTGYRGGNPGGGGKQTKKGGMGEARERRGIVKKRHKNKGVNDGSHIKKKGLVGVSVYSWSWGGDAPGLWNMKESNTIGHSNMDQDWLEGLISVYGEAGGRWVCTR